MDYHTVKYIQSKLLKPKIEALKIGNGLNDDIDLGPMISLKAVEKVRLLLQDAKEKGATFLMGEIPTGQVRSQRHQPAAFWDG